MAKLPEMAQAISEQRLDGLRRITRDPPPGRPPSTCLDTTVSALWEKTQSLGYGNLNPVLPGIVVLPVTLGICSFRCMQRFFCPHPPPSAVLASSISIYICCLKGEHDSSRSYRAQDLPKQQGGKLAINKSKAGSIGVPECLSGKIQEGHGIKHEETDKQLKE